MKILVGSTNPVKINATREAFKRFYDNVKVIGFPVSSGVSEQPIEEEVFAGAKNRALKLIELNKNENTNADFFVGIEGGIGKLAGKWFSFGGVCIIDKSGAKGYGTSALFELPQFVIDRLLNGEELGPVMDELQNQTNTKQKHGAIGFLTNGVMDRKELYVSGIITAMIPLVKKKLFQKENQNNR